MSLESLVAGLLFVGVLAYAVLAGADFGSGVWDLTAGDAESGAPLRTLVDHVIGPVWEANHVWLVYVIVFGKFANFPAGSTPYPSLVVAGVLPMQYFASALTLASMSLLANLPLVTKVYFPRTLLPLGGVCVPVLEHRGLTLVHEPRRGARTATIAGHLHPAATVVANGHGARRPCFVHDGKLLVLPAYGAGTGSMNILGPTFHGLFDYSSLEVTMLGRNRLYPVSTRRLASGI